MTQPSKKPIILSQVQMEALAKIQNEEREKSPYGAAPSIPDLARGLLDRALADVYADIEGKKRLEELGKPPTAAGAVKGSLSTTVLNTSILEGK